MNVRTHILFLSVLFYASFAHCETLHLEGQAIGQIAKSQGRSLHVCMWIRGQDGITDFRYVVDLDKKSIVSKTVHQTSPDTSECVQARNGRKKTDSSAYTQITKRVKTLKGLTVLDGGLVDTLQDIEQKAKNGWPPERWITSSPNGTHAIIAAPYKPILVVETSTLHTCVLTAPHSYLDTPVTWSSDSHLIAFVPPLTDKLYFYDAEKCKNVSERNLAGHWIQSLSLSPDMKQIAAFEFHDRRLSKTPLSLLGAMLGHPNYLNDGILGIYTITDNRSFSLVLRNRLSEMYDDTDINMEWK